MLFMFLLFWLEISVMNREIRTTTSEKTVLYSESSPPIISGLPLSQQLYFFLIISVLMPGEVDVEM